MYTLDLVDPERSCAFNPLAHIRRGKNFFLKWALQNPDTYAAKKFMQVNAVNSAEKTSGCINEFVSLALDPFNFREAETIFGNSDCIDLADIGREKTVLFLNVRDTDTTFDKVVNIIYAQALHVLCAKGGQPQRGQTKGAGADYNGRFRRERVHPRL